MATIEIKLKPFTVPNFAQVVMPTQPSTPDAVMVPSVPIGELPAVTVDAMAWEWLEALYEKCGALNRW